MMVVARAIAGKEFMYMPASAHKVNARKANAICKALNECAYMLKPGQTWHVYDVCEYDLAHDYAECQMFTMSNDGCRIRRKAARGF